jgi:hypothetical protein
MCIRFTKVVPKYPDSDELTNTKSARGINNIEKPAEQISKIPLQNKQL